MKRIFTAESVTKGHPDKMCDLIADSILDECLRKDKYSRVACEVMAAHGSILIAGEITSNADVNYAKVCSGVISKIGYNPSDFVIHTNIVKQSPDISDAVSLKGAGDQGIVYGYACNETAEFLPLPVVLAHKLTDKLSEARENGLLSYLKPDGKSQISIEYIDGVPSEIKSVIISSQHEVGVHYEKIRSDIVKHIVEPVCTGFGLKDTTEVLINPSGRFVIGGAEADTGLTGRKLMVDSYGGLARHGGGAFSGKDPTKVDRSGAYYARYLAKNIVSQGFADKCEISISYAIGKAEPTAIDIDTFGTAKIPDAELIAKLSKTDCSPDAIIKALNLRQPIYSQTAVGGHFGKAGLPWERVDEIKN